MKMIDSVREDAAIRQSDQPLIKDLEDFRRILAAAKEHDVRWCLGVDF